MLFEFRKGNGGEKKLVTKLKLDDRGHLFPEGWEKKVNHDVRMDLMKKTPTTKRGGRTYPKARNALSKQSADGARGRTQKGKRDDRSVFQLDTLREDCGIIRKQASTDGGVLWKIVCVNVVEVRRKDRSLRDPRETRSRVRI
ncbi:hypothetical protein TNCV_4258961 [Trichonephila clavipes]|nr:hypothetical protein TNCV_4258961 [Trichonephila clavipes]